MSLLLVVGFPKKSYTQAKRKNRVVTLAFFRDFPEPFAVE